MLLFIILLFVASVLLYECGTRNFDYWKKRKIVYEKPLPFFGNIGPQLLKIVSIADAAAKLYNKYPEEKCVGYFRANKPILLLRDPDLIRHVLITDFQSFYPRGLNSKEEIVEPMLKNLFFADGDLWKLLRQRLTLAFTSGKLKAMFPLIINTAEKLNLRCRSLAELGDEVDVRDLMARYTTDFIGACGFGIDADSLNDDSSIFRQLGKRIFTNTGKDAFIRMCKIIFPSTFKRVRALAPEIESTVLALVRGIMKERNHQPSERNDFIDILLELRKKGKIVGESIEKKNIDGSSCVAELEMDDLLMAAQVFVFFAAGFETSSSATSFTLHQLAFNPDKQLRCQQEVDEILNKNGGKLSYDAIKEMKYLESAFKESMRMFPSLGFLIRKCAQNYLIPGTSVMIDDDVGVVIPLQALHNDAKYFPDPDRFEPERFLLENVENTRKHVYLPFGEGPRACIGERLGLMQSLAGLASLLREFSVNPSANSKRRPRTDPSSSIVQNVKGGLPLILRFRNKNKSIVKEL